MTLLDEIIATSKADPNRVAVADGITELTYGELERQSSLLADQLLAIDPAPGSTIAVCAKRDWRLVVALLGIWKAGCAYVPLARNWPATRVSAVIEVARPIAMVASTGLDDGAIPPVEPTVWIDPSGFSGTPTDRVLCAGLCRETSDPDALAYVMFTSGSTGVPKGVSVPFRGIQRLVNAPSYVELSARSVVAQLGNEAFDASTFEIWGALAHGGTVLIIDTPVLATAPSTLVEYANGRPTVMFLPTTLFNQLAYRRPQSLLGVHTLLFGGERSDVGAVRRVMEAKLVSRLIHVYGPTECTTFSTAYDVQLSELPASGSVTIGRPINDTDVDVWSPDQRAVPLGETGELVIYGAGVALGYYRNPVQSDSAFVIDSQGRRCYRSGDLASEDALGRFHIHGRLDNELKLRGYRVALEDIEKAIESCAGVISAVCVVISDDPTHRAVAAYVEGSATPAELTLELASKVPSYMLPAVVDVLSELPRTSSGKIDRAALVAKGTRHNSATSGTGG